MTIEGDSKEYELLTKWAKDFDCQGYKTCECFDEDCEQIFDYYLLKKLE